LKVVLMSATINAEGFIDYFQSAVPADDSAEGLDVKSFAIPGKTNFPIEEYWIEDILERMLPDYMPAGPPPPKKYQAGLAPEGRNLWCTEPGALEKALDGAYSASTLQRLQNVLRRPIGTPDFKMVAEIVLQIALHEGPGAVLVFVPGWQDIADCINELQLREKALEGRERWQIFPLHSMVPPQDQKKIFNSMGEGERKIIVSTNIAETSITVEDVVHVVDTGLIKGTTYTPKTNIASLEALQISRSNSQQRRGRAGRVKPGKLFKIFSQLEWNEMPDSMEPEMQRTPVEELCLQVKALQIRGSIEEVLNKAIDPPASQAVDNALFLLRSLGAIAEDESLTALGWKLALLPIHPSLGKMILLGSMFDCLPELLSVCATLSAKSPFTMPLGKEKEAASAKKSLAQGLNGDHLLFAKVLARWHNEGDISEKNRFCYQNFLSTKTLQQIEQSRQDLHQYVLDLKLRPPEEELRPGDHTLMDEKRAELLFVLASSLQLATRPPAERKFKCLEATHAACAIHPSSVMDYLSKSTKKRQGETYSVLGWFSRLKTADLYLHDVSALPDALPLLLFSPDVQQREDEPQVFEIRAPDEKAEGDSKGKTTAPSLLVYVADPSMASKILKLRRQLETLVDRIVGQPPRKLPKKVNLAFAALRELIHASYKRHAADFEACEVISKDGEDKEFEIPVRPVRKSGPKDGGYPWWQHVKGNGKGKGGGSKAKKKYPGDRRSNHQKERTVREF